jgi:hypothetical protein
MGFARRTRKVSSSAIFSLLLGQPDITSESRVRIARSDSWEPIPILGLILGLISVIPMLEIKGYADGARNVNGEKTADEQRIVPEG